MQRLHSSSQNLGLQYLCLDNPQLINQLNFTHT